jgi:hemerythrin
MHKPFFAWQDSYSVAHPGLDAQHQGLVALINEIHSAECSDSGRDKLQALLHSFEIEGPYQ